MPIWLTISIALLTVLGSGVVSGIVTYRLNADQREREFRRVKLEECFRAVHHYILVLTTHYLVWLRVMSGDLSYNEANEMLISEGKREDREYPLSAELLIRLYFPALRGHLDSLLQIRDEMDRLHGEFVRAYRRDGEGGNYRSHRDALVRMIERLDSHQGDLKRAMCAIADGLQNGKKVA